MNPDTNPDMSDFFVRFREKRTRADILRPRGCPSCRLRYVRSEPGQNW